MARQGGHPGVFVKLAMTAVFCERIVLKYDTDVTGVRAGTSGVEAGVGRDAVVEL
jgi:hypothetical protein